MVRPIGSPTALGLYGLSTVRSCWRANSSTGWGPRSRNPLGSALEDRCGARLYHRVNPIRSRGDSPADRKGRLEDAAGIVGVVLFALAIYVAFAAELEDAPGPYDAAARAQNAGEPGRRRVAGGADDARTNEGVRQTWYRLHRQARLRRYICHPPNDSTSPSERGRCVDVASRGSEKTDACRRGRSEW